VAVATTMIPEVLRALLLPLLIPMIHHANLAAAEAILAVPVEVMMMGLAEEEEAVRHQGGPPGEADRRVMVTVY